MPNKNLIYQKMVSSPYHCSRLRTMSVPWGGREGWVPNVHEDTKNVETDQLTNWLVIEFIEGTEASKVTKVTEFTKNLGIKV